MNSVKIIENGTVFARPDNPFGYSAWTSIALNDHGEIAVAFSGGRLEHVCPFGKAFVVFSKDEGRTWSSPIVAVDTPLDDRDPGILNIGNNKMLLTTFNNTTKMQKNWQPHRNDENTKLIHAYLPLVTQEIESKYLGSLISLSEDGGFSWSQPVKIPITAPHGPNLMKDGSIIYAGTPFPSSPAGEPYPIHIYKSDDCGKSFYFLSKVALCPEVPKGSYAEPHIAELANGRLVLYIRIDGYFDNSDYVNVFKTCQSVSDDKGKTWSTPTLIGMDGAPPHLLELSS